MTMMINSRRVEALNSQITAVFLPPNQSDYVLEDQLGGVCWQRNARNLRSERKNVRSKNNERK